MFEYVIFTSDFGLAAQKAKELGLDIHQWHWVKDKFKEPWVYKRI